MNLISKIQRTTYLIDSENVCDAWIQLLPELKKKDRIIVFYTENTANLAAECVSMLADYKGYEILWEKCFTGNNALDFQLVSRLGYYICKRPKDKFVIMSNDTGYDPAIKYWVGAGFQVERMRGKTRKQLRQEKLRLLPGPAQEGAERSKPKKRKSSTAAGGRRKGSVRLLPGAGAVQEQPERAAAKQAAPMMPARFEENAVSASVQTDASRAEMEAAAGRTAQKKSAEILLSQPPAAELPATKSSKSPAAGSLKSAAAESPKPLVKESPKPSAKELSKPPAAELPEPRAAESPEPSAAELSEPRADESPETPAAESTRPLADESPEPKPVSEPELPVECILGICRSVSVRKLGMLHEALVALLGMESGREVYHFLKSNREMHEKLSTLYLKDKNERVKNYIQSVLIYHHLEPARAEEIKKILFRFSPKNASGCYKALRTEFGREEGERYYAALKSHLQMIRKI